MEVEMHLRFFPFGTHPKQRLNVGPRDSTIPPSEDRALRYFSEVGIKAHSFKGSAFAVYAL